MAGTLREVDENGFLVLVCRCCKEKKTGQSFTPAELKHSNPMCRSCAKKRRDNYPARWDNKVLPYETYVR